MYLKIEANLMGVIEKAKIYNDNGSPLRDAEVNTELIELVNSLEIDIDAYIKMKAMAVKKKDFKKLVKSMDLKLEL